LVVALAASYRSFDEVVVVQQPIEEVEAVEEVAVVVAGVEVVQLTFDEVLHRVMMTR
jgi:hypothetical protein